MQKVFELWYDTMLRNQKTAVGGSGGGSGGSGGSEKMQEPQQAQHTQQRHLPTTGDQDVDRDIEAFFAAKKALLKR